MNDSNPYESPATKPNAASWSLLDFQLAGLWIAIPLGVFAARQRLLPIYKDFDLPLPAITQLLVSFYSPIALSVVSLLVLVVIFSIPHGVTRRWFLALGCIAGLIVGAVVLIAHAIPLVRLIEGLDG